MQNAKCKMQNEQRLIDAYKLEKLLQSNSARYHHKDDVIAAIAGQPTVDAVEVVRCKDCKRWVPTGKMAGNREDDLQPIGCCELARYYRKADDFCSYGERREGE